jgi:hypothetical protein
MKSLKLQQIEIYFERERKMIGGDTFRSHEIIRLDDVSHQQIMIFPQTQKLCFDSTILKIESPER